MNKDFNSPYYPYEKVQKAYNTYKGIEQIPYKLITYLLDLPDSQGYEPADDNERPRVRLLKYLWHDGANPLDKELPTPAEKISLLFDGNNPVLNTEEEKSKHPKGYRLYPQVFWQQMELEAKTVLKVYMDRTIPVSPFKAHLGITFEIIINYAQDNTMKTNAYSKIYAMEQCLLEALNGVNIDGIGTIVFDKVQHPDNGSRAYHDDGQHIYRILGMSLDWMESEENEA